ncbi:MAG: Serine/threonine phosphatase stp [Chlamydiae bacterium]|nr:Serine/threonine phosphatase stp [Chlamydiota bacterium]
MLKTTLKVDCFGMSDIGHVRENNEDAWKAIPKMGLFMVADGVGGQVGGQVASQEAVSYLGESFHDLEKGEMARTIQKTNAWIYQKGQGDPTLRGMGTTICCLYFKNEEAVLGHVGDSRIYLLREGALKQLTKDHSLFGELMSLDIMKPEEAKHFPYKHVLTKALGTKSTVEPSITTLPVEENDLFLLCTDGLTNYVSDQEIRGILVGEETLERGGYLLVDLAKKHGGGDNITVLLVKISRS